MENNPPFNKEFLIQHLFNFTKILRNENSVLYIPENVVGLIQSIVRAHK